jgi:hypothetical protein
MKYKSLYIIALLTTFFVFSSDSCDSTTEEKQERKKAQLHKKIEVIMDGFESDYLSEGARIAFEEKAKQKLIDFGDYFTIYSDKSLDAQFREKTGEVMKDLFCNNEASLNFKMNESDTRTRMDIEELMESLQKTKYNILQLKADSVQTFSALERMSESAYKGKLKYLQQIEGMMDSDTILIDRTTMLCEFYVMKVKKNLGRESKMIWKVFLGNIEKY